MRLEMATGRPLAELELMPLDEVRERMAYAELEPWGEERMDWRFASLTAVVINKFRGEDVPPVHPRDLVPDFLQERGDGGEPEGLTPEELREMGRRLFQALSGGGDG